MNKTNTQQDLYEEIGERIKDLRKEKKLSQAGLVDALKNNLSQTQSFKNLHQSVISSIENGDTSIDLKLLIQLADYFGVSYQYLITGKEVNENEHEILKQHISLKYEECPYDEQSQKYLTLCISKALIHYLYQTILIEQYPTLPDTAQKAWAQAVEKEFYSDKDKDNYISFIPFPAENIVKDNTPNSWKQPELLAIITDYFKKTFS